ncbi:hypothetical protein GBAR_LOCUS25049, partial [Geodia barretti]
SAVYLASRVCSGVNSSAEEPVLATVLPVYCTPATEKSPQSMQLSAMRLQLRLLLWTVLLLPALLGRCCAQVDCEKRSSYTNCVSEINGLGSKGVDESLNCDDSGSEVIYVPMGSEETLVCQILRDVEVDFSGGWNFYPSNGSAMVSNVQANHSRISAETDRLTITNIQPEDEGLYACVAREGDDVQRTVIAGCIIVHGTAQSYDDSTENIIALSGEDVILPTAVVFENAGHCGVNPEYTQARLRYEPDQIVLFHCMKMPCLENSATHSYNFSALGNVTLHPPVNPGPYFMALIQMCPSPVLRMTYNVNVVGSAIQTSRLASKLGSNSSVRSQTSVPSPSKGPTAPRPGECKSKFESIVV